MKRIFYIAFVVLALSACFNLNSISLYNLSSQYSNTNFTELQTAVFNNGGTSAYVYIPVITGDFITEYDSESGKSFNKIQISYELFSTYESKHILDSATYILSDSSLLIDDTLFRIDVTYPDRGIYILKLSLTDLLRVDAVDTYLYLDNTTGLTSDNFLLKGPEGELLFRNYIFTDEDFYLQLSDEDTKKVYVRYYNRDFPLAMPPFLEETETIFDFRADSIFTVQANMGRTEIINLEQEGFYHFQLDSSQRAGFTVFRFAPGFPEITSTEQLMQPLRYITTKSEYDEIAEASDQKLALDNFWLNNAGNPSRARSMIQKYYGRVVDANNYFTSYLEGWKTDRGLIYIVYGPPRIVYRGKNLEEWLYGEKGNKNSIRFQFVKVVNPFTENDYSLIKSPGFKEKWYNIVNTWRR